MKKAKIIRDFDYYAELRYDETPARARGNLALTGAFRGLDITLCWTTDQSCFGVTSTIPEAFPKCLSNWALRV